MQPIIQLIRVDNRLVHGQTGVTWSNSLDIDTIIVIDDETVQNIFSQKLMTSIAKAGSSTSPFIPSPASSTLTSPPVGERSSFSSSNRSRSFARSTNRASVSHASTSATSTMNAAAIR